MSREGRSAEVGSDVDGDRGGSDEDVRGGDDADEDEAPVRPKRKRKKVARDKAVKFLETEDPYNIPPESWAEYSRWIVESKGW